MKKPQLKLLANEISAYGGELLKTRRGRKRGRPLDTRNTMHLSNRYTYKPFIRAVTGTIAMAITKRDRWRKAKVKLNFWNCRPFTCVVKSFKAFLNLKKYIRINQFEGLGMSREVAHRLIKEHSRQVTNSA